MFRHLLLLGLLLLTCGLGKAQTIYPIYLQQADTSVQRHFLHMENPGPAGKAIQINSRYLTVGGRPFLPVMGEVHFSRIAESQWEDVFLKMKACGVNGVAS